MPRRICILLFTFTMAAVTALPAGAQLLPQVTPKRVTRTCFVGPRHFGVIGDKSRRP
jgi:hypothetical protein